MRRSDHARRLRLTLATLAAVVLHAALASSWVVPARTRTNLVDGTSSNAVLAVIPSRQIVPQRHRATPRPQPRLIEDDGEFERRLKPEPRSEETVRQPWREATINAPQTLSSPASMASVEQHAAIDNDESADFVNRPPAYPEVALAWGVEGRLRLDLRIGADGRVTEALVGQTSGFLSLDESALAAAREWRYPPGSAGRVSQWIDFVLDDEVARLATADGQPDA